MDKSELPKVATNGHMCCNCLKQSDKSDVSGSQSNAVDPMEWYAMSATFGRAMKAKAILESREVKCFVPMKYTMVNDRRQCKVRKLVPAITNLLFAYTTKSIIQNLKNEIGYLQYLIRPENGRNIPITIPEDQMNQFIEVCETLDERLVYLSPDEVDLERGTRVRIIGGSFDGIEGTFVRVNKARKKKVFVLVKGVVAVMLAEITEGYLQVIE